MLALYYLCCYLRSALVPGDLIGYMDNFHIFVSAEACFVTNYMVNFVSLIFCFQDLSNDESGLLKSPTTIVLGAMCALSFTKFFFNECRCPCIWSIDIQN